MATNHTMDEADVRRRLDQLVEAIRARDLERLKSMYAPGVVTFDVEAPLRRVGAEAKQGNWAAAFAVIQPPIHYEVRDLTIAVGDDLAFAHGFGRLGGTLGGRRTDGFWVRVTFCLRKIEGAWLVVHDHASVPIDFKSGRASLDLEP